MGITSVGSCGVKRSNTEYIQSASCGVWPVESIPEWGLAWWVPALTLVITGAVLHHLPLLIPGSLTFHCSFLILDVCSILCTRTMKLVSTLLSLDESYLKFCLCLFFVFCHQPVSYLEQNVSFDTNLTFKPFVLEHCPRHVENLSKHDFLLYLPFEKISGVFIYTYRYRIYL